MTEEELLTFQEYRPLALRTAKVFPTSRANLAHACLGLITEIGEFTTEVKRHEIYGREIDEKMREHMIEELGDAMWYLPVALMGVGLMVGDDVVQYALDSRSVAEAKRMSYTDLSIGLAGVAATLHAVYIDPESYKSMLHKTIVEGVSFTLMYVEMICHKLDIDPRIVRGRNIAKLRMRFPDKFTDQAAEARADKGGLSALNS